ncbi:hypothetical protein J3459_006254 [Metarhizium acridum]|nr:hypothetical protein J3459_006254 [Metarhizium acridum]
MKKNEMENLTISDAPPPGARGHAQGPPQLPPQMFTTAAQLLDLTDKKLMVALRDGRKLIGVLRSWDQFGMLFASTECANASRRFFNTRHKQNSKLGSAVNNRKDIRPEARH